jgi:hypothetical protein
LLTVVKLATPPDDAVSKPPLSTVAETARPVEITVWEPPLLTVVKLAVPPEDTFWKPPLLTVVEMAVPPADTSSKPPLLTVVKLAVPPELEPTADCTSSMPPVLRVVLLAVPETNRKSPPETTTLLAVSPKSTVEVVIAWLSLCLEGGVGVHEPGATGSVTPEIRYNIEIAYPAVIGLVSSNGRDVPP